MSSNQSIAVSARHLRYQKDSSYGFLLRVGEEKKRLLASVSLVVILGEFVAVNARAGFLSPLSF